MAIDFTTFFTREGKIVKQINLWETEQYDMTQSSTAGAQEILATYTARPDLVSGMESFFANAGNTVSGWEQSLFSYSNATISDLQSQLQASNSQTSTILPLLIEAMVSGGVTVNRNTASVSSVTYASGNAGNAILVAMDNSSLGYPDERILNETVQFLCTADRLHGGTAGSETFSISGNVNPGSFSYLPDGSGSYGSFSVFDNNAKYNLIQSSNGNFDTYSTSSGFSPWVVPTIPVGTYTLVYTWVTATGETTASPASTSITTTAGQAISWPVPALPSGATGTNLYLSNGTGDYQLQFSAVPSTTWPTPQFSLGAAPPTTNTSGIAAPTTAITGTAYIPASPTQDTQRVAPATGGGALLLSASSTGPVYLMLPIGSLSNFKSSLAYIVSAWLEQFNVASGAHLTIGLANCLPINQWVFNADPSTLTGTYTNYNQTFWLENVQPNAQLMIVYSDSSAEPSNAAVLVDSMVLGAMQNFGNVQYALLRGTTDSLIGDTASITTSNNNAGVFQTFFGWQYDVQLNSSTTPSIPDSLAT